MFQIDIDKFCFAYNGFTSIDVFGTTLDPLKAITCKSFILFMAYREMLTCMVSENLGSF